MTNLNGSAEPTASTGQLLYRWRGLILSGVALGLLAVAPAWADPPTEQIELRNEQTNQGLSLRLEQRQLRLPEEPEERLRAEQHLQRERFQQDRLHQRQQIDSATLRLRQRVEPLPAPNQEESAQRSQRQLHQQQDSGQRLQFRLDRRLSNPPR